MSKPSTIDRRREAPAVAPYEIRLAQDSRWALSEGSRFFEERSAVQDTLRKIASTAKGSIVAFDYFTSEVLESKALLMRSIRASLNAGGEPLKFGVDSTPPSRERVAELLQSCGLTVKEIRTFGDETNGKRSWGGFAVAVVK